MVYTDLVSIITPLYNASRYIAQMIESVQAQTYTNWELLIVDDGSTDDSLEIVVEFAKKDTRIKWSKAEKNGGAAKARNAALERAQGRYIAYLDADDLWYPEKLERQIAFLCKQGVSFSCCDYEKIKEDGTRLNKVVHMPKAMNYNQYLRNTIIQTVGVIVDTKYINRDMLIMPDIHGREDAATWMQLLRNGVEFRGQNQTLSAYRIVSGSLSSNKLTMMKKTWYLYRKVEKLPLLKVIWSMAGWAFHACIKRVYVIRKDNASDR